MPAFDAFTLRRVSKFVDAFREKMGHYPTLTDMEGNGFAKELVESALKEKKIEEVYITLTTGAVVKGYKVVVP